MVIYVWNNLHCHLSLDSNINADNDNSTKRMELKSNSNNRNGWNLWANLTIWRMVIHDVLDFDLFTVNYNIWLSAIFNNNKSNNWNWEIAHIMGIIPRFISMWNKRYYQIIHITNVGFRYIQLLLVSPTDTILTNYPKHMKLTNKYPFYRKGFTRSYIDE